MHRQGIRSRQLAFPFVIAQVMVDGAHDSGRPAELRQDMFDHVSGRRFAVSTRDADAKKIFRRVAVESRRQLVQRLARGRDRVQRALPSCLPSPVL